MHLALAEEIAKEKPMLCDGDTWQEKWKRALFNSFLRVDAEIESVAPETVGSTSVVSVVFPAHIFVANCGDSRAVLCRGKTALPLSVDHKVSLYRLKIYSYIGCDRVLICILCSRCLVWEFYESNFLMYVCIFIMCSRIEKMKRRGLKLLEGK